jgi:hypothetical protein
VHTHKRHRAAAKPLECHLKLSPISESGVSCVNEYSRLACAEVLTCVLAWRCNNNRCWPRQTLPPASLVTTRSLVMHGCIHLAVPREINIAKRNSPSKQPSKRSKPHAQRRPRLPRWCGRALLREPVTRSHPNHAAWHRSITLLLSVQPKLQRHAVAYLSKHCYTQTPALRVQSLRARDVPCCHVCMCP